MRRKGRRHVRTVLTVRYMMMNSTAWATTTEDRLRSLTKRQPQTRSVQHMPFESLNSLCLVGSFGTGRVLTHGSYFRNLLVILRDELPHYIKILAASWRGYSDWGKDLKISLTPFCSKWETYVANLRQAMGNRIDLIVPFFTTRREPL